MITEFTPPTPNSGPRALATGADGNIWFSEYKTNRIGRITPKGVITEFPLPRPNSGPGDITMGPDGALWFVELSGGIDGVRTDGNRVGRITYDGKVIEYPIPAGAHPPSTLPWVRIATSGIRRGPTLGRVTPAGVITEFSSGADAAFSRPVRGQ